MSSHAAITHLYVVARYTGKAGGAWAGETSQFGFRFGITFADQRPSITQGEWTLPTHSVDDTAATETHGNFSVNYGFKNTTGSLAYSQAQQNTVLAYVDTYLTAVKGLLYNGYELDQVRLSPVKADGSSPVAPTIATPTGATMDPTGSYALAPEVAVCVSTSSVLRTRAGRGRWYFGVLSRDMLDTTGIVNSTSRTTLLNASAAMLQSARGTGNDPGTAIEVPIIWHRGTNTAAVISSVRIDDKFDSQHRRQNARPSNWASVALT